MSAPDLTRKVIGYRTWRLEEGQLRPQNDLPAWKVGVNKASCDKHMFHSHVYCEDCQKLEDEYGEGNFCEEGRPGRHTAPDPDCECGYYALHDIENGPNWGSQGNLLGAVAAWGRLEVHHEGFRAEYIQPIAFAYHDDVTLGDHRTYQEFAHQHGIKYLPKDELEEFAGSFGDPVPEDLIPEPAIKFEITSYLTPQYGSFQHFVTQPVTIAGGRWGKTNVQSSLVGYDEEKLHHLLPEEGELDRLLSITQTDIIKRFDAMFLEGIDPRMAKLLPDD